MSRYNHPLSPSVTVLCVRAQARARASQTWSGLYDNHALSTAQQRLHGREDNVPDALLPSMYTPARDQQSDTRRVDAVHNRHRETLVGDRVRKMKDRGKGAQPHVSLKLLAHGAQMALSPAYRMVPGEAACRVCAWQSFWGARLPGTENGFAERVRPER